MKAIIGKKIGMTGVFDPKTGEMVACTLIEAGPCVVTQIKTKEKDGYDSVQLSFKDKKAKHSSRSENGHFAKSSTTPKMFIKEFRLSSDRVNLGDSVCVNEFKEGELVDVVGICKGRGFQGVVKRHNFSGVGSSSHGQHDRQRAPGSIGGSSFPSRVFKGTRMSGRMGCDRVKIKRLKIIKIFYEKNFILVSGSVPGYNGSVVYVNK